MLRSPVAWVAALTLLAGCGGGGGAANGAPAGRAANGWRLVPFGEVEPGTLQPVVEWFAQHAPVAAAVALDPGRVSLLREARREVTQTQWPLLGVAPPGGPAPVLPEVLLREPAAAATAVDLALMACHGMALPPRLHGGPIDASGSLRPAPGDLALAMLRREHADVLTTTPATDVVFPVACLVWRADPWHDRQRDEVVAAARRYPQLALTVLAADGQAEGMGRAMQQALAANVRALVVVADDWRVLASHVAACDAQRIVRIGLDPRAAAAHVTCSVGTDQEVLGRALGEALRRTVPAGGTILVFGDTRPESPRYAGFAATLGAAAK